jgi:hypothetical protein
MQPFNRREMTRLAAFKAAVAAGFYTDDVPEEQTPTASTRFAFTSAELARLTAYRDAVRSGLFHDSAS